LIELSATLPSGVEDIIQIILARNASKMKTVHDGKHQKEKTDRAKFVDIKLLLSLCMIMSTITDNFERVR